MILDVIKEMNGEFEVDEIIATFQNFFYQRMILDITAIKNYKDIVNLIKVSCPSNMDSSLPFVITTDKGEKRIVWFNFTGDYNKDNKYDKNKALSRYKLGKAFIFHKNIC